MARKRPTSADVARLAGVSRTTVSFVLNANPGVQISPATRRRVLEAAESLGYTPSASARSLAGGSTRTLGLVVRQPPEQVAADALLADLLRGVSAAARDAGYRVLVEPIAPGDASYAALVRGRHVDGLILSGPLVEDRAVLADQVDLPVVLHGSLSGTQVPSVDVDNRAAARSVVEHLIGLGHRAIACVANSDASCVAAEERLAGYREALEAAGIPRDERLVTAAAFDANTGHAALTRLLRRGVPFSAVFAGNDVVALGVIAAARASGLRVPGDLSVVGFDDIPLAAHFDPPLTTVRVPAYELGFTAGRALVDRIAGRLGPVRSILATRLVVRESATAPDTRGGGFLVAATNGGTSGQTSRAPLSGTEATGAAGVAAPTKGGL